jgi:YesN/AraC family two-component response regulator
MPTAPTATRTRPPDLFLPSSLRCAADRYAGTLRVLLVDDESAVLLGVRRLLRSRGFGAWDVELAVGAPAALERLAARPFDVVVADMRMPRVDGATLLRQVADEYPALGRVVLSGYTDGATVRRALRVAHRFLAKPCGADALIAAIYEAAACPARDRQGEPPGPRPGPAA